MELGFFHKDVLYALHIDARGSRSLELSYKTLSSLEDVVRGLHKPGRKRSFGKEYDIIAPWPCYVAAYYDRDSEGVVVDGSSWSLQDFLEMVHRVCMSPKHICARLLKEEDRGGGGGGDVLGHFSLVGMATWLRRLWVCGPWPGHRVRMMSHGKEEEEEEEEEEMDEATIDFQDCLLKLQGISIIL